MMTVLTILAVALAAPIILLAITLAIGSSAIIIGFGDVLIYVIGLCIIVKLIINAVKGKKKTIKKSKKNEKK